MEEVWENVNFKMRGTGALLNACTVVSVLKLSVWNEPQKVSIEGLM